MRVRFWGVRGSVPVPDRNMLGYGGNTSCVEVELEDGTELILDAGSGIRGLVGDRGEGPKTIQLLLTHLHLDHIQGLLFFPPLFDPENQITVYGPPAPGPDLDQRLARYLSAPLSPVDLHELPARVMFAACPYKEWEVGSARVEAAIVAHRGVTLGYRITEGEKVLTYIPDHEPALGSSLEDALEGWISGIALAHEADVLIHDGQYFDREYSEHLGWGHSGISDAVTFGRRAQVKRLVLFHHDPAHDDATLDELGKEAGAMWDWGSVLVAREGETLEV